jgi:hypothetical protein
VLKDSYDMVAEQPCVCIKLTLARLIFYFFVSTITFLYASVV